MKKRKKNKLKRRKIILAASPSCETVKEQIKTYNDQIQIKINLQAPFDALVNVSVKNLDYIKKIEKFNDFAKKEEIYSLNNTLKKKNNKLENKPNNQKLINEENFILFQLECLKSNKKDLKNIENKIEADKQKASEKSSQIQKEINSINASITALEQAYPNC